MAKSVKKEVVITATDRATKTLQMVAARFSKFSAQIQSVQRQTKAIGKSIGQVSAIVGGVATAVGAGIKKISDYGDEMLTLAGIVGIPVEALQKLRYAAIQNDVSAAGFDKSLQMLSKTMGEFNTGQGTLYTRLSKSNPALLRQLKAAKGNEDAFRIMMNAINNTTDAQEKAFLATSAFGRAGQELISLANIGAEEMARWEKEAEKFGVISENDADAMDTMNKAIDRVKFAGQGLAATIASKVVPSLTPLINQLADWVAENRELIATKVSDFISQLTFMFKTLLAILTPVAKVATHFSWVLTVLFYAKLGKIALQVVTLGKTVVGLAPAFMGGIKALGLFTNGISSMSRAMVIVRGLLGKSLFNAILTAATTIWTAVKAVWAFNAALWANPITWIVAAIIALCGVIYLAWKNWDKITAAVQKFADKYPIVKKVFAGLKTWFNAIIAPFKILYKAIMAIIDGIKWLDEHLFGKKRKLTVEQQIATNDWMGQNGLIQTSESPAMSPLYNAQSNSLMSPVPEYDAARLNQSQISMATMGGGKQSAAINVRFDNLPTGARVDTKSTDADLDVEIYRGINGGVL